MEKKRVLVVGCNGKMGQLLCKSIAESKDFKVVAGYDVEHKDGLYQFPTFCSIAELEHWEAKNRTDLIFDFSRPTATMTVLEFAEKYGIPMVIATTGFDDEQEEKIRTAANHIWIFKSSNMSYGVNAVAQLLKSAAKLFPSANFGVFEFYHADKLEAPCGSAKNLFLQAINESTLNVAHTSSCRASLPCEQVVTFATPRETFNLHLITYNLSAYIEGALEAARFLLQQPFATLYSTEDMIAKKLK